MNYRYGEETILNPIRPWTDFIDNLSQASIIPEKDPYGQLYFKGFPRTKLDTPDSKLELYYSEEGDLSGLSVINCCAPILFSKIPIGDIDIDLTSRLEELIPRYNNPMSININYHNDIDTYKGFNSSMKNTRLVEPGDIYFFSKIIGNIKRSIKDPLIRWESKMDIRSGHTQAATIPAGKLIKRGLDTYWFPTDQTNIPNIFYNPKKPNKSFSLWIDVGYRFNQDAPTIFEIFPAAVRPGIIYPEERETGVKSIGI